MGLRFRKSFKIAPGVKVNIGKKSVGMSVGGKYGGVSVNSKTGARARMSAPGTGISYSEKLGKSSAKSRKRYEDDIDFELSSLTSDELIDYSKSLIESAKSSSQDVYEEHYAMKLTELSNELERRNEAMKPKELQKMPNWAAITIMILGILFIVILGLPMFSINPIFGIVTIGFGALLISVYFKNRKLK